MRQATSDKRHMSVKCVCKTLHTTEKKLQSRFTTVLQNG